FHFLGLAILLLQHALLGHIAPDRQHDALASELDVTHGKINESNLSVAPNDLRYENVSRATHHSLTEGTNAVRCFASRREHPPVLSNGLLNRSAQDVCHAPIHLEDDPLATDD